MGAGNKVEATAFVVADIYATSVCPLAKVMRHELRRRGIPSLKVVYSKETVISPKENMPINSKADRECPPDTIRKSVRRQTPGSNAFVPPVVGFIIAGEIVKYLTGYSHNDKTKY